MPTKTSQLDNQNIPKLRFPSFAKATAGRPGFSGNKKMKLLNPIIEKYKKLDLSDSSDICRWLIRCSNNSKWMKEFSKIICEVKNGDKIINISKEITKDKNDQRVLEMLAECDVAKRIINNNFFGDFKSVEYLLRDNKKRKPDFLAFNNSNNEVPIEVKLLSPDSLDEKKFFQKMIDKVNNHAIEQLKSFYEERNFNDSFIFIWTHKKIPLFNINYHDLDKYIKEKVDKQKFEVKIIFVEYGVGLWDFYIDRK